MKRRKSETMLLKECLHLYIEPRLLRIQPPESLELRAVAYFISASTVLTTGNSYAPKKHHSVSKNGKSSPNPALKTDLIDGIGKKILGIPESYCHPDRKKVPSTNNTSNNFQGHPTLRELEMIIDGGKYFLRLQLSGKTDSKGLKGQTQTSCTSKAWVSQPLDEPKGSLKEVGCGNIYNSISESIAAAGDRENVEEIDASREKERERERVKRRLVLWAGIQRVTDILSIRLHQCQHALRISSHCTLNGTISSLDSTRSVTNALRSNFGSSNSINGGFSTRLNLLAISTGNSVAVEVNSVTFMDVHTKNSSLNPCNVKSSLDELLRVDALLEEAGRGLSIQGEYAYVRLQSLIFAGMKNLGSGSEHQECQVMRGVSLEEMEGKGEVGLRKDPTEVSHDVILPPVIAGELYCWCRGNDDGFPMVQCDGCDEWFHSRCMGITKQSQAKPQKQEADKQLKGKCVRGSSYLPTMNIQATDVEEHSDSICTLGAERPFMKSVGKCKAAAITKSKGKGKGIKLMKHLEESVEDTFYCISCAERRGTSYAFEWHSDSSTARPPILLFPTLISDTVD